MTIFGIDISEHQNGLSLTRAKRDGIEFVILRLCDGTYVDKTFRSHLADAEKNGLMVSTYWYLRAPSEGTTIAQQVDVIDRQMGGRKDLGVWIDVESVGRTGLKLLTGADVWEAKHELEKRGYYVPGIYSGAWYWEHMPGGEPSMEGLGHLWVSNYGSNRTGTPYATYNHDGGDTHRGWSYPLGDQKPDLLQFGSNGIVAGWHPVDVNAFRGTRDELARIFTPPASRKEPPVSSSKPPYRLDYPRDHIAQDTFYNCGPASVQTIILAATGEVIAESTLGQALGTTRNGTDYIGQFPKVLNEYMGAAKYKHRDMPNDPPTNDQKEQLWRDLTASLDAGYGVVANIVAPPHNYPKAVSPSTIQPVYKGGWVYHYIALMGYSDEGVRKVWVADSGFYPFGYWIAFDQLATLIPPKGYAYATTKKKEKPMAGTILGGVSAAALDEAKIAAKSANDILTAPIPSAVNKRKAFTVTEYLVLIDRAVWEQRELLKAIAAQAGLNPDKIIAEATARDNGGK